VNATSDKIATFEFLVNYSAYMRVGLKKPVSLHLNLNSLLLLLLANADVQVADNPAESKYHQETSGECQRLPELGGRRILVDNNEVAVTQLVDNVDGHEVQSGTADSVHERAVKGGRVGDERDRGLEVGDAVMS
jgi:hypothetical protein